MYHPLLGDPRKLKDLDLEAKIIELSKKYHIAATMGQGAAASQIVVALDMYKSEQDRRYQENMKTVMRKQDKDLDDLINVD
jgi:hypothetical protein